MPGSVFSFAFGIPPIKVIASIGKHSDRMIECGNCFGVHLNCDIGAHCKQNYTHFVGDWQSLISMFFYVLKNYET